MVPASRPLAVVLVADPNAVTTTNLRQLLEWCDVVVCEGTTTLQGAPRSALRGGWQDLLAVDRPRLRVVTSDLGGDPPATRERLQRDAVAALLVGEDPARPVLLADADEFIDRVATEALLGRWEGRAVRLGLVPLYGAIDRVARSLHCCWRTDFADLRDPDAPVEVEYTIAAPTLATVADVLASSATVVRFRSPRTRPGRSFGVHVTMCGPAIVEAAKLDSARHHWDPRVRDPFHLETVLSHGVHHAGWWIAAPRSPEPWLESLAEDAGLRRVGPAGPPADLRALRAWAEARLDPTLPDGLVRLVDAYVRDRPAGAADLLGELDEWQLGQEVVRTGRIDGDGSGDHEPSSSESD